MKQKKWSDMNAQYLKYGKSSCNIIGTNPKFVKAITTIKEDHRVEITTKKKRKKKT